jgi:hypothetical protein
MACARIALLRSHLILSDTTRCGAIIGAFLSQATPSRIRGDGDARGSIRWR